MKLKFLPGANTSLIIGSKGYACILIHYPEGIDGYTALKGKASRF